MWKPQKFSTCGGLVIKTLFKLVNFRFGRGQILKIASPSLNRCNIHPSGCHYLAEMVTPLRYIYDRSIAKGNINSIQSYPLALVYG